MLAEGILSPSFAVTTFAGVPVFDLRGAVIVVNKPT
jgi:hypothetical protein